MKLRNDFYSILEQYLTNAPIIQQCIIKDYVTNDDKTEAIATILLQNNGRLREISKVRCAVGIVDFTFENYMYGLLFSTANPYQNASDISGGQEVDLYSYFNQNLDRLIVVPFPTAETLPNILSMSLTAKEAMYLTSKQFYLGDTENNVLNLISEFLVELETFFKDFASNAPTISSYPADGAAKMVTLCTDMQTKTKQLYDTISPIVNLEPKEEEK